eukprot:879819_1
MSSLKLNEFLAKSSSKNHLLESIQNGLKSFDLPSAITDKILDILLVYSEGFHQRLYDILQLCDDQQPPATQSPKATTFKPIICKLALAIWILFLRIIQFCLLSCSASGNVSKNEQMEPLQLDTMINQFLDKFKQLETESIQTKTELSNQIHKYKQNMNSIVLDLMQCKSTQRKHKQNMDGLQSKIHDKTILIESAKNDIAKYISQQRQLTQTVHDLQHESTMITSRTEQLNTTKQNVELQNDSTQNTTKAVKHKITSCLEECEEYQKQYQKSMQCMDGYKAKSMHKKNKLQSLKSSYDTLQNGIIEIKKEYTKHAVDNQQLKSQTRTCIERAHINNKSISSLNQVVAEYTTRVSEEKHMLVTLNDELSSIIQRKDDRLSTCNETKSQLDAKHNTLDCARKELEQGVKAIECIQLDIECLQQNEDELLNVCKEKREAMDILADQTEECSNICKRKQKELHTVEKSLVDQSNEAHVIQNQIDAVLRDMDQLHMQSDALQNQIRNKEIYHMEESEKYTKEMERHDEKTLDIIQQINEHKQAIEEMDEEIRCNETKYEERVSVCDAQQSQLEQLQRNKDKYDECYRELIQKYKDIQNEIGLCDQTMAQLYHKKEQQQQIDSDEWESKICKVTQLFDDKIQAYARKRERMSEHQEVLRTHVLERYEYVEKVKDANQKEINRLHNDHEQHLSMLEAELNQITHASYAIDRDEVEALKKMIEAASHNSTQNEREIYELKREHIKLSHLCLCNENWNKERTELNEYLFQLKDKMHSLQESEEKPVNSKNVMVGTDNFGESEQMK